MEEEYLTLKVAASAEFTERRSRFISDCAPVSNEEEAAAFLQEVKSHRRDANHHVYAYSLRQGHITRHSDDGEPQGTAGLPVLDVLRKSGVTDAAVVVTRYFGGILLGTGGLVRAYSHAASLALEQSGIAVMKLCSVLEVCCSYAQYSFVCALIPQHGGNIEQSDYTESVRIRFYMENGNIKNFKDALSDATCGACSAAVITQKYFDFS
ncbi:YigZ family protein [Caproiciproducens sp. NJN-50]|uniref:YigZ family protein n=1 Tax=Acutalibacteraceae TaxID=3082771 RepID=UPI000FFE21A3|nr:MULTISPECIES: YigZ family protein [Acutalibacteraceae]QAT49631.1 YigZ family protein [Caproiciproducens sp. NJN-50]